MNSTEAMNELTTDQLSDPDYALPIIRAYLNGGGHMSAGWVLALVSEIERLYNDIETNVTEAVQAERQRMRVAIEALNDAGDIGDRQALKLRRVLYELD